MSNREMMRFRESFRGYNRDDVNAYIEQLNIFFSRKEAELRAVITDLENNKNASNECSGNSEVQTLKNEIDTLKAENEHLKAECLHTQSVSEEDKSKLYDSMSAQVGNIIIVANNNAEKIISDAQAKAEEILANAQAKADIIVNEAEVKKADALVFMETSLKNASNECLTQYNVLITEATEKLSKINDEIKNKTDAIIGNMSNKSKELETQINNL